MAVDATPASASPSAPVATSNKGANASLGTTEGKGKPQPASEASDAPYKGTKHRVKVGGVEMEVSYEDLVSDYQRKEASQRKFNEAANLQKASTELLQGLASGDPNSWGWLKKNVPKDVFRQVAFDYAYQEMEYDNLPPDKKKEMELTERERKLLEAEKDREEKAMQQQWQAEVQSAGEHIQTTIEEFFKTTGKQPSSALLLRMSEYMLGHLQKNGAIPSMQKLYEHVNQTLEYDAKDVVTSKEVDELLKWLPKEKVQALKKKLIEEATASHPRRAFQNDSTERPVRKEVKRVGIDDAFKRLEQKIKRGR